METDLTVPQSGVLAKGSKDELFQSIAKSGDFLPRLQLMGSNSDMCKVGKIPIGSYAFLRSKEDFEALGEEVDVLVVAWRPKAMDIGEEVISIFDQTHPEFLRIQAQSNVPQSTCMCGPEFLLWIPDLKEFATFYMASKTARRQAPALRAKIDEESNKPGPATLGVEFIKTKKYSWHGPIVGACSVEFDMPEPEKFVDTCEKFANPPQSEAEVADDSTNRER